MSSAPRLRPSRRRPFDARQIAFMGGAVALVAVLAAAALTPALLVSYGLAFHVETTFARMWPLVLLTLSFATVGIVLLLGLRVGGTRDRTPAGTGAADDDFADVAGYACAKDSPAPVAVRADAAANDPTLDAPGPGLQVRPQA